MYISDNQLKLWKKLGKSQKVKDLFFLFSSLVWEKLEFFKNKGADFAKVDERQLTNDFVSCIANLIHNDKMQLPLRLFQAKNEKVNGADLELIICLSDNQYVVFHCQAKRLYVENKSQASYFAMKQHKKQVSDLLGYAQKTNAVPLYFFYNYVDKDITNEERFRKEIYGCTILGAEPVQQKSNEQSNFRFENFHPPAEPLMLLSEFITSKDSSVLKKIGIDLVSLYTKDDLGKIFNENYWKELNPPIDISPKRFYSSLDFKQHLNASINDFQSEQEDFNPAFRVVFTNEIIYHRKRNFDI